MKPRLTSCMMPVRNLTNDLNCVGECSPAECAESLQCIKAECGAGCAAKESASDPPIVLDPPCAHVNDVATICTGIEAAQEAGLQSLGLLCGQWN
eukprot:2392279-Pleurochrysis_carterae.AAC.5